MKILLMFGRNFRYIFAAIISMVFLNVAMSLPTHAALEQYAWSDYTTIEGFNGIYGVIANTGGDEKTAFAQRDTSTLTANKPSESCQGSITIKLDNNDSSGTLSSNGECSPFQSADKNIRITGQDVARDIIEEEDNTMGNTYIDRECTDEETKEDCITNVKQEIGEKQAACLEEYDYKDNVAKGDAYLNCISGALGVDRPGDDSEEDNDDEKCTIPDTGWIICQANLFVAGLTDNTFNLLKPFLIISPLEKSQNNTDSSTYKAWESVRSIANVILVIALLVIIYSQLTGVGIDVYHIKKMTPRLIVAAILINISFVICSLAIDASNVVGVTVQGIIKNMDERPASASVEYSSWKNVTDKVQSTGATEDPEEDEKNKPDDEESEEDTNKTQEQKDAEELDSFSATKMVVGGTTITGIAVMFVQLSALMLTMVIALFALATVLLVLMMRMALVIILVVLAPLAFACILLPNTKKWYDRWQSLFVNMMILFPAIALVFGASSLAASVIGATAVANGQVLLAIFSMGIQVIPLFVAPLLIKIGGGVMSQFAGFVNNKRKGLYDRSMNRAREFRGDRKAIREIRAARGTTGFGKIPVPARLNRLRPINRRAVSKKGQEQAAQETAKQLDKFNTENSDAINKRALRGVNDGVSDFVDEALDGIATTKLDDIETNETNAAEASILSDPSATPDVVMDMAASGERDGRKLTEAEHRAAVRVAGRQFNDAGDAGNDGVAKANRLVAQAHDGGMSQNVRRELVSTLRENKIGDKAAYLSGSTLGKIERGEVHGMDGKNGVDGLVQSAAGGGKFSQQSLAGASSTTLQMLDKNMGSIKPEAASQIRTNASNVLANPNLSSGIRTESRGHIERLSK